MKGVIISINPHAMVIDITHEIEHQDIREGAFLLKGFYSFSLKGQSMLPLLTLEVGGSRRAIAIKKGGYFFIGPDNGIFSLILKDTCEVYSIENRAYIPADISPTFHGRDIFSPGGSQHIPGVDMDSLGKRVSDPVLLVNIYPRVESDILNGEIVHFGQVRQCHNKHRLSSL